MKKRNARDNDDEIVTRKILREELNNQLSNFVTEDYLMSNFVTKDYLKSALVSLKGEILSETRSMMYEIMTVTFEGAKEYYKKESDRYMSAMRQGFVDEMLVYKDGILMIQEKVSRCENRLDLLESKNNI